MKVKRLIIQITFLLFAVCANALKAQPTLGHSGFNPQASLNLIERMLPGYSSHFVVEHIAPHNSKDVFEIESRGSKIVLRGNTPVAVASAFNYYLKNVANCQITWNGSNTKLSLPLPVVKSKIIKNTPYNHRYYLNYCTFNYTMSWWDWKRWEWEIDWMAMNGINIPLAVTGQNIIHKRVYNNLGFSDKELASFFSGPAYFSWFWMGNLDGWGGPLPLDWMKRHEELQKKILARERSLGMTPILPAFTGHVPPSFKNKFPNAKLNVTSWNGKFPDVYLLSPDDPMFAQIGRAFIQEQTKAYGTNHYYSADTFNENRPPSNDSLYLNNISKKVYESMAGADPKAVWVMQGWLFHFSAKFWQTKQIKALLNAVPNDKMMVLDLWSERHPLWQQTQSYYGKPWLWNMLSNFGGNISLQGVMDVVATEPARALTNPKAGNMIGIGLTPEGIEQNPVMYELMTDNTWRNEPINVDEWLTGYVKRRYGKVTDSALKAWQILRRTVYNDTLTNGGPESIVCARPTLKRNTRGVTTRFPYSNTELLKAWKLLQGEAELLKGYDGYEYDMVDLTRQLMANYASYLQQKAVADYNAKNMPAFKRSSRVFIELIEDMDALLLTRKDFLLGKWLNDAKRWGTTADERQLYEKNARNLITLWGDKNSTLREYACKQWAGLLKGYYKPRWENYFAHLEKLLAENKELNQDAFDESIKNWEWKWVNSNETYTEKASGNALQVSQSMFNKYYNSMAHDFATQKLPN
ncbi:alpha-N-acetylglucosaminidase [Mucilaginibacter aquatilis]|uniref:Alpha-N-acetylglucosaminidase n=1 Tax=Mucilaginibacter aquatilis TaxID=1517760 RepID=A0A6I4IEM7_9SPHI|nr:alpha-N-acetylglucosaminidase [Mucilaginibacter aquatilis]MVN91819.1 alpha-N-acetylglucosaminidase [Mucilaginibacter aquatilis]